MTTKHGFREQVQQHPIDRCIVFLLVGSFTSGTRMRNGKKLTKLSKTWQNFARNQYIFQKYYFYLQILVMLVIFRCPRPPTYSNLTFYGGGIICKNRTSHERGSRYNHFVGPTSGGAKSPLPSIFENKLMDLHQFWPLVTSWWCCNDVIKPGRARAAGTRSIKFEMDGNPGPI